ncbi:hypothetical protein V1477_001494 [Vespula maculifrons]|uniref:Uncharacterized protein n=1 Tax=Vespula maculifrons TaxID=7453 RepID=A0ABD2CYU2_VESMC
MDIGEGKFLFPCVLARELESGKLGLLTGLCEINSPGKVIPSVAFEPVIRKIRIYGYLDYNTCVYKLNSNLLPKNEDMNQTCKKVIIQYQIYLYSITMLQYINIRGFKRT